jgi:hypothetical protein
MRVSEIAFVASALWIAAACSAKPPPPYKVVIKVQGDPGEAIPGAKVFYDGKQVGKTDSNGTALLGLRGAEGQVYSFAVTCPDGFASPDKAIQVSLHRLSKRPEYPVFCPPTTRTIVVAVRAVHGPNLPVVYLGKPVAQTDESGAANVLLRLPPNQSFKLTLDTSSKDASRLRPQNPVQIFEVKQDDDIFVFNQEFKVKPVHYVFHRRGPTPL